MDTLTFVVNELEKARAVKWITRHKRQCGNTEAYKWVFTPTGIGDGVSIQCPQCGSNANVSDYDSW